MRILLYLLVLLSTYTGSAQNTLALGPSIGFGIPAMTQSNSEADRPSQGVLFGLRLEVTRRLLQSNIYLNTGLQTYVYFFTHSNVRYGTEPVGPLGLSVGVPVNLQVSFPGGNGSALRVYGGVIPMIETGGLARASEQDGAVRPNIAPDLGVNVFVARSASIGLKWYMPLRQYGSNALHSTYYLQCLTFEVTKELNVKRKNKQSKHPYKRALG